MYGVELYAPPRRYIIPPPLTSVASGPNQIARGPVLESSMRAPASCWPSSPISPHLRLMTSESRAPVSVGKRMAATGRGCSSRCRSSTVPRRSNSE